VSSIIGILILIWILIGVVWFKFNEKTPQYSIKFRHAVFYMEAGLFILILVFIIISVAFNIK